MIETRLSSWLQLSCCISPSKAPPLAIIHTLLGMLTSANRHKFASNVVEHSIEFGTDEQRREIVKLITTPRQDGTSPLQILMRDQYGNYVIQRLLAKLCEPDKESFIEQIKPQIQALKKFTYPKQITAVSLSTIFG